MSLFYDHKCRRFLVVFSLARKFCCSDVFRFFCTFHFIYERVLTFLHFLSSGKSRSLWASFRSQFQGSARIRALSLLFFLRSFALVSCFRQDLKLFTDNFGLSQNSSKFPTKKSQKFACGYTFAGLSVPEKLFQRFRSSYS